MLAVQKCFHLYVFCLGVLICNVMFQAFEHDFKYIPCFVLTTNVHYAFVLWVGVFLLFFLHLRWSVHLSIFNTEGAL